MDAMPVLQFVLRSRNKLCRSVQKLCIAVRVRGCVWVSKASTGMMLNLKGARLVEDWMRRYGGRVKAGTDVQKYVKGTGDMNSRKKTKMYN
jgi:hypothetical protein